MTTFILNNKKVTTDKAKGMSLLDFIRYEMGLPGTKIGCREGDCGACTVLEGTLDDKEIKYKSIVSCLTPLGNAHGKHIVTLEGINMESLTPVQKAMVDNAATQCGFCTPGFVMSFTGHSMEKEASTKEKAIGAVSGNICRCTGYKSIERAAETIAKTLEDKNPEKPIEWLVEKNYLPKFFLEIPAKLATIEEETLIYNPESIVIGGGTDLMVQKHDEISESNLNLFYNKNELKGIAKINNTIFIGACSTANEIMHSEEMLNIFPEIKEYFKLISSEPIRNMGTIAGNIMNASPIGDLSIFFLALNACVHLVDSNKNQRTIILKDFFIDYKKLDIKQGEFVEKVSFNIPKKNFNFNFEKVSKRTHLDIASVNSAILVESENNIISSCFISAGGVKAIPLFLKETSAFLIGKEINQTTIKSANEILQKEISPISDVRGTEEYKRLLLRQLFFAHFAKLFPNKITSKDLLS